MQAQPFFLCHSLLSLSRILPENSSIIFLPSSPTPRVGTLESHYTQLIPPGIKVCPWKEPWAGGAIRKQWSVQVCVGRHKAQISASSSSVFLYPFFSVVKGLAHAYKT